MEFGDEFGWSEKTSLIFIELKIIRKEINDRESNDEDGDGIIIDSECEKSAESRASSNINEPLDFLISYW